MNAELTNSVVRGDCPTDSNEPAPKSSSYSYSREKRSIYSGLESAKQRFARLSKQRIRNIKNRAQKTKEEKKLQRDVFNAKMRERRASESSNQKFWRLVRRRQYRKYGLHLLCVEFQYHRSKNQYGLHVRYVPDRDVSSNSNIIEVTEIGMKAVFSVFYELLDIALAGKTIPADKFKIFDHYGIHVPNDFFEDYLDECYKIPGDQSDETSCVQIGVKSLNSNL